MDREPLSKPYLPLRAIDWQFVWYYAFGNTTAEDLLEQIDFSVQKEPKVLMLGCGDIRSCFFTLWKHFDFTSVRQSLVQPSGVHFVLNDVSPAILARNVIFLYLALKIPHWKKHSAVKQWISGMWTIWYCHELLPTHNLMFTEALDTLLGFSDSIVTWKASGHPISQIVKFTDENTLKMINRMWMLWRSKSFGKVEDVVAAMTKLRSKYSSTCSTLAINTTLVREIQAWLKGIRLDSRATDGEGMIEECSYYGVRGSVFAEECLNLPWTTKNTVVNPTMFEREDGEYSLHYTALPFECFHHGLFYSRSRIQELGMGTEFSKLGLIVEDDGFEKQPLLANCVQQFSMWVSSTAATLKARLSKQKQDITFSFNCSDCIVFCEELQSDSEFFRRQVGFLPSFDYINTSNMIDRVPTPVIVLAVKQLLKKTGFMLTTTLLYKQFASTAQEFLTELFGFGPEWLPLLCGVRCMSHDGQYTDSTSIIPKHTQLQRNNLFPFSTIYFCRHKTLIWQKVESQPIVIRALETESVLLTVLYDAICSALKSFYAKMAPTYMHLGKRSMCVETAIAIILSFVSQLDADVDISNSSFWDNLCSLIKDNVSLNPFLVHLQTQALLHGLHFHLTLSKTDCPVCLKKPLEELISQFSIEFDPRDMEQQFCTIKDDTPVYVVYVHKIPIVPRIYSIRDLLLDDHIVDSALCQKLPSEKLKLSFFFPTQFAENGHYCTVVRYALAKFEKPDGCIIRELSQLRVSMSKESYFFNQAGVCRNKTVSTSLGSVLSHSGDCDSMDTTLSLGPKSLSRLSSKTSTITVEQSSPSFANVCCGKHSFTIGYPYPVDASKIKRQVSCSEGTVAILASRRSSQFYDERASFFVNPCHFLTLPTLRIPSRTAETFGEKQMSEKEELSMQVKPWLPMCNLKLFINSMLMLDQFEAFEIDSEMMKPLLLILIHRRVCDTVRYTPILEVYYLFCGEASVLQNLGVQLIALVSEIHPTRLASRPIDNSWPLLKKFLPYCASRTRKTNSNPPAVLQRLGLEKSFTRAILYPLYCDQDVANYVEEVPIPSSHFLHNAALPFFSLPSSALPYKAITAPSSTDASLTSNCSFCGSKSDRLKKCGRCSKAWYCGKECQVKHWKEHKLKCKPPEHQSTSPQPAAAVPIECSNCGKHDVALNRCARCQLAAYCSKECQRNDWARHKSSCCLDTE